VRKITGGGIPSVELLENKKLIAKGATSVNKTIESLMGLNLDAFSAISYVRQGEISSLTLAPPGEREGIVNSILALEIYEEASSIANEERKELDNEVKQLYVQITEL